MGKFNEKFIYITMIENNIDNFFIDDIPEPVNLQVAPPSLAFLTNNETNYSGLCVALILTNTISNLSPSSIYKYCFSYYNSSGLETEMSDSSFDTYIGADPYKIIINLPISPSSQIMGRYIYRTKANSNVFYLLSIIPNNTSTIYIDNSSDSSLDTKTPLNVSTIPQVARPSLTYIGGIFFTRPYTAFFSQNFVTEGAYKYKFTYVISSSVGGELGETTPSNESETVIQPANKACKILVNVPTSFDKNVIKRNIYRTRASDNIYKYVGTINDNNISVFLDNVPDSNLGRPVLMTNTTEIIAPETNTTVSGGGNTDPINNLISEIIKEDNVPVSNSNLFKLYVKSGRYAKDTNIYNNFNNTIQMNLENMEINIKSRLRGLVYDITKNSTSLKNPITKQFAELIFGTFNNTNSNGIGGEPDTMVREVIRVGNTKYGIDVVGNNLDMLNNETNADGSYKVISEIQYIIDFTISLVQKNIS